MRRQTSAARIDIEAPGCTATTDGGSSPSCNPAQALCPCGADGGCADGTRCVGGSCIVACEYSFECGQADVCFDGACVPGCSAAIPCSAGTTCAAGGCVLDPANPVCGSSSDCPDGESCSGGVCASACARTSECGANQACAWVSRTCIADPQPRPDCSATTPCPASQICGADGFCRFACTSVAQCQAVDSRFVACTSGVCETQAEASPQCTLAIPCPSGQHCVSNECH